MGKKSDIRSYCNPYPPRFTKDSQLAKLTGETYIEDKTGKVIEALIHSVRSGSIIEVVEMGLLAPIKAKPARRRKALAERVERIKERGGVIRELNTGWQSGKGQLPRMVVRASEFIATSGRAGSKHGQRGNPIELTPADYTTARMTWRSREYGNDTARLAAIEKAIGQKLKRSWCWNEFGSPSGVQRKNYEG